MNKTKGDVLNLNKPCMPVTPFRSMGQIHPPKILSSKSWCTSIFTQCNKIYTDWANHYLQQSKDKRTIKDLQVDICDGTILASIIETITKEKISNIVERPITEKQMIENIDACLQFLKKIGLITDGISTQDIRDGNLKSILSLFFTLSRYSPPTEETSSTASKNNQGLIISKNCDKDCFIKSKDQKSRLKPPKLNTFSSNCATRKPPYGGNPLSIQSQTTQENIEDKVLDTTVLLSNANRKLTEIVQSSKSHPSTQKFQAEAFRANFEPITPSSHSKGKLGPKNCKNFKPIPQASSLQRRNSFKPSLHSNQLCRQNVNGYSGSQHHFLTLTKGDSKHNRLKDTGGTRKLGSISSTHNLHSLGRTNNINHLTSKCNIGKGSSIGFISTNFSSTPLTDGQNVDNYTNTRSCSSTCSSRLSSTCSTRSNTPLVKRTTHQTSNIVEPTPPFYHNNDLIIDYATIGHHCTATTTANSFSDLTQQHFLNTTAYAGDVNRTLSSKSSSRSTSPRTYKQNPAPPLKQRIPSRTGGGHTNFSSNIPKFSTPKQINSSTVNALIPNPSSNYDEKSSSAIQTQARSPQGSGQFVPEISPSPFAFKNCNRISTLSSPDTSFGQDVTTKKKCIASQLNSPSSLNLTLPRKRNATLGGQSEPSKISNVQSPMLEKFKLFHRKEIAPTHLPMKSATNSRSLENASTGPSSGITVKNDFSANHETAPQVTTINPNKSTSSSSIRAPSRKTSASRISAFKNASNKNISVPATTIPSLSAGKDQDITNSYSLQVQQRDSSATSRACQLEGSPTKNIIIITPSQIPVSPKYALSGIATHDSNTVDATNPQVDDLNFGKKKKMNRKKAKNGCTIKSNPSPILSPIMSMGVKENHVDNDSSSSLSKSYVKQSKTASHLPNTLALSVSTSNITRGGDDQITTVLSLTQSVSIGNICVETWKENENVSSSIYSNAAMCGSTSGIPKPVAAVKGTSSNKKNNDIIDGTNNGTFRIKNSNRLPSTEHEKQDLIKDFKIYSSQISPIEIRGQPNYENDSNNTVEKMDAIDSRYINLSEPRPAPLGKLSSDDINSPKLEHAIAVSEENHSLTRQLQSHQNTPSPLHSNHSPSVAMVSPMTQCKSPNDKTIQVFKQSANQEIRTIERTKCDHALTQANCNLKTKIKTDVFRVNNSKPHDNYHQKIHRLGSASKYTGEASSHNASSQLGYMSDGDALKISHKQRKLMIANQKGENKLKTYYRDDQYPQTAYVDQSHFKLRVENISCTDEKVLDTQCKLIHQPKNYAEARYDDIPQKIKHEKSDRLGSYKEQTNILENPDKNVQYKNLPTFTPIKETSRRELPHENESELYKESTGPSSDKGPKIMNTVSPYIENGTYNPKLLASSSTNSAKFQSPYAHWTPQSGHDKSTFPKLPTQLNPYRPEPPRKESIYNAMAAKGQTPTLEDLNERLYSMPSTNPHPSDYAPINYSTLNPYHAQSSIYGGVGVYGLAGKPFPKSRNTPSVISFKSTPPPNYASYGGSDCGGYQDNYLKRHHIFNPRNAQRYTHYQTSGNQQSQQFGLPFLLQQRSSHRPQPQKNLRADTVDKFMGINMALNLPNAGEKEGGRESSADEALGREMDDDRILKDLSSQLHKLDQKLGLSFKTADLYGTSHNITTTRSLTPSVATLNSRRHNDLKSQIDGVSRMQHDSATKPVQKIGDPLCATALPIVYNNPLGGQGHSGKIGEIEKINTLHRRQSAEASSNDSRANCLQVMTTISAPKYSPSYVKGTPHLRSSMDCHNASSLYPNGMMEYDLANGSMLSLFSNVSSIYSTPEEKQAHEIRKLKRELDAAQEKVFTLTNQLSTNTHVVAAFEQSLINMTQRFQNLSATATAKDDELLHLRETIDTLNKHSQLLQNKNTDLKHEQINTSKPDLIIIKTASVSDESTINSAVMASPFKSKKKKNWLRSSFTKAFSRTKKTKALGLNNVVNQKNSDDASQRVETTKGTTDTASTSCKQISQSPKTKVTLNPNNNFDKKSSSASPRSSYSFSSSSNESHLTPRSSVISGHDSMAPLNSKHITEKSNQPGCAVIGVPLIHLNDSPRVVEKIFVREQGIPTTLPVNLETIDAATLGYSDLASDENLLRFLSSSTPEIIIKTLVERLKEKNTKLTTFQLETLASHHRMTHMKETLKRMRKEMMDLKKDNDRLHKILTISAMHKNATSSGQDKKALVESGYSEMQKAFSPTSDQDAIDPCHKNGDTKTDSSQPASNNSANDLSTQSLDITHIADEEFEKNRNCAINYIDNLLTNLASYDYHMDDAISFRGHDQAENSLTEIACSARADPLTPELPASMSPISNANNAPDSKMNIQNNQKGVAWISPSAKISQTNAPSVIKNKLRSQVFVNRSSGQLTQGARDEIPIGIVCLSENTTWDTLESCLKRLFREFVNRICQPFPINDDISTPTVNDCAIEDMRFNEISYYAIDEYYPSCDSLQTNDRINSNSVNETNAKALLDEMGLSPEDSLWSYDLKLCVMHQTNNCVIPSSIDDIKYFDKTYPAPLVTLPSHVLPYDMLKNYNDDLDDTLAPFLKIHLSLKGAPHNSLDSMAIKTMVPKQYLTKCVSHLNESKNLILTGPICSTKSLIAKLLGQYLVERDYYMSQILNMTPCPEDFDSEIALFDMKHKSIDDLKRYLIGLNENCQNQLHKSDFAPGVSLGDEFETVSSCMPKVILIDNLPSYKISSLSHTFNGLSLLANCSKNSNLPYIIITANTIPNVEQKTAKRLSSQGNLLHFKFLTLNVNEEPLAGMLLRCFNQRLIAHKTLSAFNELLSNNGELKHLKVRKIADSEIGHVLLWVNQLWLKVNSVLENYNSTDASIGPCYFMNCPLSLTKSQSWFHSLWNGVLIPYMSKSIRQGSCLAFSGDSKIVLPPNCWEDPTNWVVQSYPWQNIKGFDINSIDDDSNHLKRLKYEDLFISSILSPESFRDGTINELNNKNNGNIFDFQPEKLRMHTSPSNICESNPQSPMHFKNVESDPLLNMLIRLKEAANYTGTLNNNNTEDSNSDYSDKSLSDCRTNSLKSVNKKECKKSGFVSPQTNLIKD